MQLEMLLNMPRWLLLDDWNNGVEITKRSLTRFWPNATFLLQWNPALCVRLLYGFVFQLIWEGKFISYFDFVTSITYGARNERFGGCGSVLNVHNSPSPVAPLNCISGVEAEAAVKLLKKFYEQENENAPEELRKRKRVT